MSGVIDLLMRFNRKERFILLNHALGQWCLDRDFSRKVGNKLGLEIPSDAFVAMDYHLDWLQIALHLADQNDPHRTLFPNGDLIRANQEDIDLLIAFKGGSASETHLVLIEAKADTSWNNAQLNSKARRLKCIFDENSHALVQPHFILTSPREPRHVKTAEWPCWMKPKGEDCPLWLELPLSDELLKVTRWNEVDGKADKNGNELLIKGYNGGTWAKVNNL